MRVVLDTNILLSALISPAGAPARIYEAWKLGRFELVTSVEQLEEFARVTRYPAVRALISSAEAASADFIVTGDKSGVLTVRKHGPTRVITAAGFAKLMD